MRRILCFGDSNTYGHAPDGTRYDESLSWPGVLGQLLGDKFEVITEAQNGRTVAFDDPYLPGCNGMNDIEDCLERHDPLDLVVIMLGTNDLKKHFEATPQIVGKNLLEMCKRVQGKTDAKILLASPMLLGDQIEFSPLHLEFGRQAVDYSFEIAPETEKVAKEVGAEFIDMALVAVVSDVDCLHLVPEEHAKVAQAVHGKVMDIFGAELEQEAREEEEARRKAEEEEAERLRAEEEARREAEAAAEEEARREAEAAAEEAARREAEAAAEEEARREAEAAAEEEARREAEAATEEEAEDTIESAVLDEEDEEETVLSNEESDVLLQMPEDDDDEDRMVEEEARLKVEAILKAAEEEVAKEEAEGLGRFSFVGENAVEEEDDVPLVSDVIASRNTTSEKEKMLEGRLYKCDAELRAEMAEARKKTTAYNQTMDGDVVRRSEILESLVGKIGKNAYVEPPFRCDYGSNISIGDNFYANFDCIMLDVGNIKIGNNVFFGPKVNVYTACHPIYAPVRNEFLEYSKEVTIGDDVWVGGNVTINPGVHIGNNVVIGSGSVVTTDIPDGVVAAGNPCRIIRRISDEDKEFWEEKKAEYNEK
nr:hypothetical protein [Eubacterium sp.]